MKREEENHKKIKLEEEVNEEIKEEGNYKQMKKMKEEKTIKKIMKN